MASKAVQIYEGEWIDWPPSERWVCCDCSLTHRVEWRKHQGRLQIRMFRANRSTAMYRRHEGIKIVKRKSQKSGKHKSR